MHDPKVRHIHKASVRDRVLHHAVVKVLNPIFESTFIHDSYSCWINKGAHRGVQRFISYARRESENYTQPCWVLKCDVKKFFASIDQNTLIEIVQKYINDENIINLLKDIIFSFKPNGLPLGNLTSQLFANIYLNELDQFVKHKLKVKHYIRYVDDFIILSDNKNYLKAKIPIIQNFLNNELKLTLHPNKVFIKTLYSGVDFLGWVNFIDHRVLRTKTKNRMLKRIKQNLNLETINSYLGLLRHGNANKLKNKIIR